MDIDIDFKTSFEPLAIFKKGVKASMVQKGNIKPHPSGVYLQRMQVDPITKLAAIPYKEAEELGFYKLDCLHLSSLDVFETKEEIKTLMHVEPDWDLFTNKKIVKQLPQIHRHFDTISKIKPTSVLEIADCIALIRPAKTFIIPTYITSNTDERNDLRTVIYMKPEDDKAYFKKGHAVAYAFNIILELHKLG